MATPKNRHASMKVFVYYNLHKNCLSIKALEGAKKGRLLGYASQVEMRDVVFKVSQAGRLRVLAEFQKNVHAGVTGELLEWRLVGAPLPLDVPAGLLVSYNPYRFAHFYCKACLTPIHSASRCVIQDRAIFVPREALSS